MKNPVTKAIAEEEERQFSASPVETTTPQTAQTQKNVRLPVLQPLSKKEQALRALKLLGHDYVQVDNENELKLPYDLNTRLIDAPQIKRHALSKQTENFHPANNNENFAELVGDDGNNKGTMIDSSIIASIQNIGALLDNIQEELAHRLEITSRNNAKSAAENINTEYQNLRNRLKELQTELVSSLENERGENSMSMQESLQEMENQHIPFLEKKIYFIQIQRKRLADEKLKELENEKFALRVSTEEREQTLLAASRLFNIFTKLGLKAEKPFKIDLNESETLIPGYSEAVRTTVSAIESLKGKIAIIKIMDQSNLQAPTSGEVEMKVSNILVSSQDHQHPVETISSEKLNTARPPIPKIVKKVDPNEVIISTLKEKHQKELVILKEKRKVMCAKWEKKISATIKLQSKEGIRSPLKLQHRLLAIAAGLNNDKL